MRRLTLSRLNPAVRRRLQAQLGSDGRGEDGAVAMLVAILLGTGVLLGIAAITMDTGSLLFERRQLQNGADAASLSLAQDCGLGSASCSPANASLAAMGNANAADGFTKVESVCAAGTFAQVGLFNACSGSSTGQLVDCPAPPASGNYVEVRTQTSTDAANTGTLLKPILAQMLAGNSGYQGTSVRACARAGWGPGFPSQILPVVQAECAWKSATTNGTDFAPDPSTYTLTGGTPPNVPVDAHYVTKILLHTKGNLDGTTKCGSTGPGLYTPGNFGWLDSADKQTGCSAVLANDTGPFIGTGKPGASATKGCKDTLPGLIGSVAYIPIFTYVNGTGANTVYTISGVSAFYLAGFTVPGGGKDGFTPKDPHGTATVSCASEKDCIWGWFLTKTISDGSIGTGADRGTKLIRVLG